MTILKNRDSDRDDGSVVVAIKHFPRGRLLWRLFFSTEQAMGRLPVVILTPLLRQLPGRHGLFPILQRSTSATG